MENSELLTIQYASDIHTEFYKIKILPYIKPVAECLILAGNIGYPFSDHYKIFLDDCAKKFKYVFIIAGNHEYYQNPNKKRPMIEIDQKLYELCLSHPNTFYLNRDIICINEKKEIIYYGDDPKNIPTATKILIAGTTLWSFIPTEAKYYVTKLVSDYQNIYKGSDTTYNYPHITTADINSLYLNNIQWLLLVLQMRDFIAGNYKVIVVTHHSPSFELFDTNKISKNVINSYASEIDGLFKMHIDYWIFGHIKQNINKKINDTEFYTNCFGFKSGLLTDYTEKYLKINQ